jgi:hypothetical protein
MNIFKGGQRASACINSTHIRKFKYCEGILERAASVHKKLIVINGYDLLTNIEMTGIKYLLIISVIYSVVSCEPALRGDLKIYNETNELLTATFVDSRSADTIVKEIQPNSHETIKVLDGRTGNHVFDCCACQLDTIFIQSASGQIKKDPTTQDNWQIPNKKKLKKFGGPDIKCEFHVTSSDL